MEDAFRRVATGMLALGLSACGGIAVERPGADGSGGSRAGGGAPASGGTVAAAGGTSAAMGGSPASSANGGGTGLLLFQCKADMDACSTDEECCDAICSSSFFSGGDPLSLCRKPWCTGHGGSCERAVDCCASSLSCAGGYCVLPPPGPQDATNGACKPVAFNCRADGECCDGRCQLGYCQPPGCAPLGDPCASASDCCGISQNPVTCAARTCRIAYGGP